MEVQEIVVSNIRSRVERLHSAVENGNACADNLQYRLDSLCRDVLQHRDYLPNFDIISINVMSAKQTVEASVARSTGSDADRAVDDRQPPATTSSGCVGRPKFNITEEQLRFFIGKRLESNESVFSVGQFFLHSVIWTGYCTDDQFN